MRKLKVEQIEKALEKAFVYGLNNVVVVMPNGEAFECHQDFMDEDNRTTWTEIKKWEGDKPKQHELALVIHDDTDNIIDYGGFRDNTELWEKFNAKLKVFSEPYNSWKMGIYEA